MAVERIEGMPWVTDERCSRIVLVLVRNSTLLSKEHYPPEFFSHFNEWNNNWTGFQVKKSVHCGNLFSPRPSPHIQSEVCSDVLLCLNVFVFFSVEVTSVYCNVFYVYDDDDDDEQIWLWTFQIHEHGIIAGISRTYLTHKTGAVISLKQKECVSRHLVDNVSVNMFRRLA